MPLHGIARMISTILYSKRFFPYYVYNILGGLDEEGRGGVYSFDPVGSYEREFCRAAGSAQSLLQPFLDTMVMFKNQQSTPERPLPIPGTMKLDEVLRLVMDGFAGATERQIEVGDGLEMYVVRTPQVPAGEGEDVQQAAAPAPGSAMALDLAAMGGVEALGGEDESTDGAVTVIRRELKKD